MVRESVEFPVDEFLQEFPELAEHAVKIYVDLQNAREIIQFLAIEKNRKRLRRILVEIFNFRYNNDLYGREEVSQKATNITAMKFSKRENVRIYCKEYVQKENEKTKKIVMLCLYHKKEMKGKKMKSLIL